MKALMKLVDYLTETGMREEDANALVSQLLEEEASNYIAFKETLKKKAKTTKKKVVVKKKAVAKKATAKKKVAKKPAKKVAKKK